ASDIEPLREAEVGQFAALWARVAGFDFVTADRAGLITAFTPGSPEREAPADGAPIHVLVAQADHAPLRQFLSLPARYAGGVRPAVTLKGARADQTLTLFAEGRAGIVAGYFGLIGPLDAQKGTPARRGSVPAATLSRITR